jgi:hypothetical protein
VGIEKLLRYFRIPRTTKISKRYTVRVTKDIPRGITNLNAPARVLFLFVIQEKANSFAFLGIEPPETCCTERSEYKTPEAGPPGIIGHAYARTL